MRDVTRQQAQKRLARIAGQVSGIRLMVAEDRYCVDILTQIAAVRAALDQLGVELLTSHLETCVLPDGSGSEHPQSHAMKREDLLEEVRTTLKRFLK